MADIAKETTRVDWTDENRRHVVHATMNEASKGNFVANGFNRSDDVKSEINVCHRSTDASIVMSQYEMSPEYCDATQSCSIHTISFNPLFFLNILYGVSNSGSSDTEFLAAVFAERTLTLTLLVDQ